MPADEVVKEPGERRRQPIISTGQVVVILAITAVILIGRVAPFGPTQEAFGVFGWLTEQAIRVTSTLFERWGYQTVFIAPMLENTLFVGAIVPGTIVMLLAGLAVNDGTISYWWALPLATLGAMIGDTVSYAMGRFGARRLGQESRLVQWAESMREPLMRHSVWLILTYHFAGYSRLVGPAAAGFLRMPFLRWAILDYIGVFIWVFAFITGGWLIAMVFGIHLDEESDRSVQIFEIILFAIFIIAIVALMRANRRQRKRRTAEEQREEEIITVD